MAEIKSFFDILKVMFNKSPYPSEQDINTHTNQWMLQLYFSCDPGLAEFGHELSKMKLSNKEFFDVCYYGIPRMPNKFIKYNAKKAKKEQEIQYIMTYYSVNAQVAKTYAKLISKNEMEYITDYFENRGVAKSKKEKSE